MTTALNHYLEIIRHNLRIDLAEEKEVISELETHIEDKLQELKECGLSEEEAESTCLGLLGSARVIARQIYEAHSQGSWCQAFLAAMPHLLFAALFALNWWHHIGWLSIILAMVIGTSIYGWWHGKPAWVFPWLGFSLVPVAAFGIILLYLPKEWTLLTIPFYFLFALWWLFCIVVQTTKRDWLLSSLMLLPVPIIIGWFLTLVPDAKITAQTMERVNYFAPWIALSFLILALTIAAFIRLRQRWLRIALLIISGLLTLTTVVYYVGGKLDVQTFAGLILVMWGLFLVPPLLERWLRKSRRIFKRHVFFSPRYQ
ncbi:MAG: permease prefix domain 1-containing protein [Dehalococcoidales bacterium]